MGTVHGNLACLKIERIDSSEFSPRNLPILHGGIAAVIGRRLSRRHRVIDLRLDIGSRIGTLYRHVRRRLRLRARIWL